MPSPTNNFFCYVDDRVTPYVQAEIWSKRLLVFWQMPKVWITTFAVFLSLLHVLKTIFDTFWLTRNACAISGAMAGLEVAQHDFQRAQQVLQATQGKLQECESNAHNRIDNRTFLQKVASGLGMKQYSKDNINKRNVGKAHQKVVKANRDVESVDSRIRYIRSNISRFEERNEKSKECCGVKRPDFASRPGKLIVPWGWRESKDSRGRKYYENHHLRTTQWELPAESKMEKAWEYKLWALMWEKMDHNVAMSMLNYIRAAIWPKQTDASHQENCMEVEFKQEQEDDLELVGGRDDEHEGQAWKNQTDEETPVLSQLTQKIFDALEHNKITPVEAFPMFDLDADDRISTNDLFQTCQQLNINTTQQEVSSWVSSQAFSCEQEDQSHVSLTTWSWALQSPKSSSLAVPLNTNTDSATYPLAEVSDDVVHVTVEGAGVTSTRDTTQSHSVGIATITGTVSTQDEDGGIEG